MEVKKIVWICILFLLCSSATAWYGSYDYRRSITDIGSYTPALSINHTYGFNSTIIWAKPDPTGTMHLYYNDQTDYAVVVNDSVHWSYETEGLTASSPTVNNTPTSVYDDDIILAYHYGDTTRDSGHRALHATNTGAAHNASCKFGYCYYFNRGEDDKHSLTQQTVSNDFTVMMWVYRESTTGSEYHCFIDNGAGTDNTNKMSFYGGSNIFIRVNNIDNGNQPIGVTIGVNEWHLISIVRNSTDDILVYVNDTYKIHYQSGVSGDWKFDTIGNDDEYANDFDGRIDEVKIYNRSLSANEIATIYNNTLSGQLSSMTLGAQEESTDNFTISCQDAWNSSQILNCSALVNGSYYHSNATGQIVTALSPNDGIFNITVNSTILNYFDRTYQNYNISTDLTAELYQAVACFDTYEKISNANLSGLTYYANGKTTDRCFNMSSGSHTVTATKTGYYNISKTILINASDNVTYDILDMYSANLTIRAQDNFTGAYLSNYNVTITSNNHTWAYTADNNTNISIGVINGTYNISVSAPNYFLITHSNIAISDDLNYTAQPYQAVVCFDTYEKFSNNSLTGITHYIENNQTNQCFNMSAGSYNVTTTKTGYYNLTTPISINAFDNGTIELYNMYSAIWNITAVNVLTGEIVTTWDINITALNASNATENSSDTAGSYIFNAINGTYNIIINQVTYALMTFNITINDSVGAVNLSIYPTNSFNFTIRDEETEEIITGKNITLELIGDFAAYNLSTTNGTIYDDLLYPQLYLIRYSANDTYDERFYYFNLTNRSSNQLTLYLLNTGSTGYTTVTATVYDETNHFVEGAYIKALRYYIDTNSYRIVEMARTNFEGVTQLRLIDSDEFYKFIIEYPFGVTKKETDPMQPYASTLNFQILLSTSTAETYYKSMGVDHVVSFENDSDRFRYYWNDNANTVSQACLKVYSYRNFKNSTVNITCQSGSAGILYQSVTPINGTTYEARAYVSFSPTDYYIDGAYHTYQADNPLGVMGVLAVILITLVFIGIGYWHITVAVILTPIPAMMGSIGGIIDIAPYVTIPLWIMSIIVAYIISKYA